MGDRQGPVVVGVDGSANSQRAVRLAAEHARAISAPLVVVHAVGLTDAVGGEHITTHGHREEIARQLEQWCRPLADAGVSDLSLRLVDGSPVDVLLRVASQEAASVVVVGRRGVGGRPELLVGSTAHQIIEHASCPVLVVPPIARTASGAR